MVTGNRLSRSLRRQLLEHHRVAVPADRHFLPHETIGLRQADGYIIYTTWRSHNLVPVVPGSKTLPACG